jgi:DNA-binding GntR family transcriptional regulator
VSVKTARTAFAGSPEPISRGCLRQQVAARILTAIFQGDLPSGRRLIVQRLAESYGVSPTPVREALVELAGHGMVELLPNRGAIVRPFGQQEFREISQLRRVLEVEATRDACGRIAAPELAALKQEFTRLRDVPHNARWDQQTRASDTSLHGLIAESCGSSRLAVELNRYLLLIRALRDVAHQRDARTNYTRTGDIDEHLAIVDALIAGRAEEAARAMEAHIRSATHKLETVLFAQPFNTCSEKGD